MNRTQILLNEHQYAILRKTANSRKVSIARLIREAIDMIYALPDSRKAKSSLIKLAGIGKGSGQPIARNHDQYLYPTK